MRTYPRLNSRILDCFSLFFVAAMFVNIFFGFDSHHDGLVLTTVRLFADAITSGSPFPFNQYGSTWVLPFLPLAFLLPDHLLYFSMRILTFTFYVTTALLLRNCSRLFFPNTKIAPSRITLIFFATQPFYNNFGSSFVVWPSSAAMPLTVSVLILSIYLLRESNRLMAFVLGVLLFLLCGMRIQVGVLSFFTVIIFFYLMRKRIEVLFTMIGIFTSFFLLSCWFFYNGWFEQTFQDAIVYSTSYLTGDRSTYPFPKYTILLTILLFLLLIFPLKIPRAFKPALLVGGLLISIFLGYLLLGWEQTSKFVIILSRRIVVTSIIATHLYFIFRFFKVGSHTFKTFFDLLVARVRKYPEHSFLIVLSTASLSQAWPLFDQMHVWWGAALFPYLSEIVFASNKINFFAADQSDANASYLWYIFGSLIATAVFMGTATYLHEPYSSARGYGLAGIKIGTKQANDMDDLSSKVEKAIAGRQTILNLCENSDIFLISNSNYRTASSYFVVWASMTNMSNFREKRWIKEPPTAIITCTSSQIPSLKNKNEEIRMKVLEDLKKEFDLPNQVDEFTAFGRVWQIYTR